MSKKITYNADALESVKIKLREVSKAYEYKPYKKRRFRSDIAEGIYKIKPSYDSLNYFSIGLFMELVSMHYFDVNYIFENNIVYIPPKVTLKFISGESATIQFGSDKDAMESFNEYLSKINNKIDLVNALD